MKGIDQNILIFKLKISNPAIDMDEDLQKAIEFHGHMCLGLAIGYRVAKYVREHYGKAEDEELVAIVDNNSCSVDAIQQMLSCTFGKGNLIFKDYGKQAFTFYSRGNNKALRIYFKGGIPTRMGQLQEKLSRSQLTKEEQKELEGLREQLFQYMLNAPDNDLLSIEEVDIPAPEMARIYPSLKCEECGENFMEIKGRTACGEVVCKECFEKLTGKSD
ncbi:MAG: FmdE family protein [Methanotrichaceae archaeon]